MKQIRARQIELIKQHQEQQKEKSGQAPQTNPFSPPGNAAPAAKPPATASTPPKK
jgi:hypothetical protein